MVLYVSMLMILLEAPVSTSNVISGFDGGVNPMNNLCVVIPHELNSIAFFCDSSEILFASKKKF